MLIFYHHALNIIWGVPIKNRSKEHIIAAFQKCYALFKNAGANTDVHVMDKETSRDLKDAIAETTMTLQLVPPNQHRANLSERSIQTWKCHFISGLSGTSTHFPLKLWDALIEQANITLKFL